MKRIEAVFIDRDGTLGGTGHFIHPKDFKLYPFTLKALDLLKSRGIKIFALTNQHRISKGEVTIEDLEKEFASYGFLKAYICPHPLNSDCECQKPKPGMLLQAAFDYNLNLENCVVIGDVGTDMIAASRVNAKKILVKTGWGNGSLTEYRSCWQDIEPEYVAEDLLDAVEWILKKNHIFETK